LPTGQTTGVLHASPSNICLPVFGLPPSGKIEIPASNGTARGFNYDAEMKRVYSKPLVRKLSEVEAILRLDDSLSTQRTRRVEALIDLNMNLGYGGFTSSRNQYR
jgi:hypothetical protein